MPYNTYQVKYNGKYLDFREYDMYNSGRTYSIIVVKKPYEKGKFEIVEIGRYNIGNKLLNIGVIRESQL